MRKHLVAGMAFGIVLFPGGASALTLEEMLVEKGIITKSEGSALSNGSGAKVYYSGGTRLEFPDSGTMLQLNSQIQSRYTFTDKEDAPDTSSFEMRRVRLIAQGHAMHKEFNYYLQADFVGTRDSDGARTPDLRDAWLQWNAADNFGVRMGQYKVFVSRQENSSSSKLQFADRSTSSTLFELGRQQGVSARFTDSEGDFFSAIGLFNGESDGEGRNRPGVDNRHTGAATLRYNVLGAMDPFEEGDISHTSDLAMNVGAAYAFGQTSGADGDADKHTASIDTSLKLAGWSLHGEFFWRSLEPDLGGSDSDVEPLGFYAQSGYFIIPKKLELAGRFAWTDCDDGLFTDGLCEGNEEVSQATAGLSYHFYKHNLKAQLNFDWISEDTLGDGSDVETNRVIFQLSSYL